jgi:hypothetical protein
MARKKRKFWLLPTLTSGTKPSPAKAGEFEKYLDVPVLAICPHVKDLLKGNVDGERMADILADNINTDELLDD